MKVEKLCCYFSKFAYYTKHELINTFTNSRKNIHYDWLKSYTEPHFYSSSKDAQCFVTTKGDTMYIVFRGTESIRDWLTDANIIRVPMDLPNVEENKRPHVHWGFLRQFRSVQNDLDKEIVEFEKSRMTNDSKKEKEAVSQEKLGNIIICGHSLGGAMCSLAGLQFAVTYPRLTVSCYTYGSPRVGCSDFVSLFKKNVSSYKRFVNEDDPVTMIPFAWRFTHLPGLCYMNKNNKIIAKNETTWWRIICDSVMSVFGRESPVGDHSCNKYLEKLDKCIEIEDDERLYPAENVIVDEERS